MLDLAENNDHFEFDILLVAYIQVCLERAHDDQKLGERIGLTTHLQMVVILKLRLVKYGRKDRDQ